MNGGKRILFLTPQFPFPPEQGGAIRNYHLIRETAKRHNVGLLSLVDEQPAPSQLAELACCNQIETVSAPLRSRTDRIRTLFASRDPDMAHRLYSADYVAARCLLAREDYDILQVEGMEMAAYGLLTARPEAEHPIVFDDLNAETLQRRACVTDLKRPGPQAVPAPVAASATLRKDDMPACRCITAVSQPDAEATHGWPSARAVGRA